MTSTSSPPPAAKIKVRWQSWWMVGVLFFLYTISILDRIILTMLVTPIKEDLLLSDFQMSLILGPAFAVFYALFGLPLGWATDRYPRRWVAFCGVILWSVMATASGFARSFTGLLIARIGVGVGEAALSPAAYSLLADEFPRERLTTAISIYQMAAKFGTAGAFAIGGVAIAFAGHLVTMDIPFVKDASPWQLVFIMAGLPGILAALLLFTFSEPERKGGTGAASKAQPESLIPFLRQHGSLMGLMILGFSAVAVCGYSLTSWVPTYIERSFGWDAAHYGPILGLVNIVAGTSLLFNGALVDRIYARGYRDAHLRVFLWLLGGIAPLAFLMFSVTSPIAFLIMYGAVQIATLPFMVYISSIVSLLAPNRLRGQLNGLFLGVITVLGMGSGPMLVGGLTDFLYGDESRIGSSLTIVLVTAISIALVSLFFAMRRLKPAIEAATRES